MNDNPSNRVWYTKGEYVAIITDAKNNLRVVWFTFPAGRNDQDAGWYYLNVLDSTSFLEAVYPASLFQKPWGGAK